MKNVRQITVHCLQEHHEEDGSDFSIHQFIAKDEARDLEGSDDTEADAASMDTQRSVIQAREASCDSKDEAHDLCKSWSAFCTQCSVCKP